MTGALSPTRWAADLTKLLDLVHGDGASRFPIDVPTIAREISHQRYPGDAITLIEGDSLGQFDGALYKAPAGKSGWGIIYNNAIASPGRINFTLGHEFGHYLLHRLAHPNGIECGQQDILRGDAAYRAIEQEANIFAAGLLMPFNDFRAQIPAKTKPTLDDLGRCADRYGVSLTAVTLRWLEYTSCRSVLVVSRDGYILWARSSQQALKTGAYFKTAGRLPIEIPAQSLAAQVGLLSNGKATSDHDSDIWFAEPCAEIALVSDHYDVAISLLHLDEAAWPAWELDEEEPDTVDLMSRQ